MQTLLIYLKVITQIFLLCGAIIGSFIGTSVWFTRRRAEKNKLLLSENEINSTFASQFNDIELKNAISGYVVPHCSPSDPTNRDGEEFLADTRESIFSYLDRNINNLNRSYNLLLADTGMGKTSLCLNYFVHIRKKFPDFRPHLISLASHGALEKIRSIPNKTNAILIADALDEDPEAISDGRARLMKIIQEAADFKFVLITCRSQYFLADDQIPRETPLPILVPRSIGQSQNFSLVRSYISPFSSEEISAYIARHFPLWMPWKIPQRIKARKLASEMPDLAHRPMLLERLPEIIRDGNKSHEIYDLYDFMIEGWFARESRWMPTENLRSASHELASRIYSGMPDNGGRISIDEMNSIAQAIMGNIPEWKHLSARSLMNRDSRGMFKFAHKSILEFLIVKSSILGDKRSLEYRWTPFMKDLFISWGHSSGGQINSLIAAEILESDDGRRNIAPLYDSWAAPASATLPDFKRSAERRLAHSGARLAPASWRPASLQITTAPNKSGLIIHDHEFNLKWLLVDSKTFKSQGISEKLIDVLKIAQRDTSRSLPSYDQFVCLIDGLFSSKKQSIIPSQDLFVLSDRPASRQHLLVNIGKVKKGNSYLKNVDRERSVGETSLCVNAYSTGLGISGIRSDFANNIYVRQMWLIVK